MVRLKINQLRLFSVAVAALLLSVAFASASAASGEQNSISGWLSKATDFLSRAGGLSRSVTGYQVDGGTASAPDLSIADIRVSPVGIAPTTDTEVVFDVVVKNIGNSETTDYAFSYDFGDGSGSIGSSVLPPLVIPAGGSRTETLTHFYKAAGTYTVTFSASASSDADTSNNKASSEVVVAGSIDGGGSGGGTEAVCVRAGPSVAIGPDYQEGKRGGEITSAITVVNNDNSACGPSRFYVWGAAADSEIYADSPPNLLKPRPAISPGGSSTYELKTRITSYAVEGKTYRTGARVKNAELDYYSAPNYEAYAKVYVKPGKADACSDSDGGINYGKKGTLTVNYNPLFEEKYRQLTDTCSERTLTEYYCDIKGAAQTAYYTCPYVCEDGACLTTEAPAPPVCGNGICEPGEAGCPDILCVKAPCPKVECKVSACPQDCESRPVPPEKQSYVVKIVKGWNLISVLPIMAVNDGSGSGSTTCSFLQGDPSSGGRVERYLRANMYGYDAFNNRYVSLADLGALDITNRNGYIVNTLYNGYWLRSGEDCLITLDLSSVEVLSKISGNSYRLVKGWNFFSVLPEMEGKALDDIKGGCEVKKAYAYEPFRNRWTSLAGVEFSRSAVGYGFVLKVSDDCVLGPSSTLPPPLPEEGAAKMAVTTTTATAAAATVAVRG